MVNPYAAPTAEPLPTSSPVRTFDVPGVAARLEYQPPGMWTGSRLLADGQPVKRSIWGKLELPGNGGTTVAARIVEGLTGPSLKVGSQTYPIGPRIPAFLGVLALLPVGLVAAGGAIGGLFGAAAWIVSRRIALSERSLGVRVALMSTVLLTAVAVVLVISVMLQAVLGR